MKKKITSLLLAGVFLAGCGKKETSSTTHEKGIQDPYGSWQKDTGSQRAESYTADYECHYTMTYSDDTKTSFDLFGNLKKEKDNASFTQKVNSNGSEFTLNGYYLDGRLYNTYNGISYYEDMDLNNCLSTLLVPFDAVSWKKDQISSITGEKDSAGNTVYKIVLTDEAAKTVFADRYDSYGLKDYDDYSVDSSSITMKYDSDHECLEEKTDFTVSVSYSSQPVKVRYESDVKYSSIGKTEVSVSDDKKKELASYVPYSKIDTSGSEEESDGDTVTEQFRNRIVSQLGYEKQDDGTYKSTFNTNEMYVIDFNNCTFTYAHYSIQYVYNWKNDSGSASTCNYNFRTENGGTGCDTSVIDALKEVKEDLEMELFYCGLSLEDLQGESAKK